MHARPKKRAGNSLRPRRAGLAATLAVAVGLEGCEPAPDGAGSETGDKVRVDIPSSSDAPVRQTDTIAAVNGFPISGTMYQLYAQTRKEQHPLGQRPERAALTQELINLVLLAQKAEREGLHEQAETAERIRYQRINILAGTLIGRLAAESAASDEEVRQEYERRYGEGTRKQYKTRNILVTGKTEAEHVIRQLRRGRDFAELAREKSVGPAAGTGGALEWFSAEDVLKEFSRAVAALEEGEFTREPVHTTYGWHVILLEDAREAPAPELDEVRETIRRSLFEERLDAYLEELRSDADIVVGR